MSGSVGDFMIKLNSYQHGDFFIAVFEINSPHGADCFYGWESDDGDYIGLCIPTLNYYDPERPARFSLCLAVSPGDVIFRFDDPDGEWLLALAARLSEQLAKLEVPAEVRECLQRMVNYLHMDTANPLRNPSDAQIPQGVGIVRDWLDKTS